MHNPGLTHATLHTPLFLLKKTSPGAGGRAAARDVGGGRARGGAAEPPPSAGRAGAGAGPTCGPGRCAGRVCGVRGVVREMLLVRDTAGAGCRIARGGDRDVVGSPCAQTQLRHCAAFPLHQVKGTYLTTFTHRLPPQPFLLALPLQVLWQLRTASRFSPVAQVEERKKKWPSIAKVGALGAATCCGGSFLHAAPLVHPLHLATQFSTRPLLTTKHTTICHTRMQALDGLRLRPEAVAHAQHALLSLPGELQPALDRVAAEVKVGAGARTIHAFVGPLSRGQSC